MLQHVKSELKMENRERTESTDAGSAGGTCSMRIPRRDWAPPETEIEIGIRIGTMWQLVAFKSLIMGIVYVCNIYVCAYIHIHSYNILSSISFICSTHCFH